MSVAIGDRWYAIECLDVGEVDRTTTSYDHEGKPYISEEWRERAYTLRCACGKMFDVPFKRWKGKSKTRDCGCGLAASLSGAHVVMAFSTRTGTRELVKYIADSLQVSVSWVVNSALRSYIDSEKWTEDVSALEKAREQKARDEQQENQVRARVRRSKQQGG